MKPIGVFASVFSLIIAIALAAFGIAMRAWLPILFSAICLAVAGYLWFIQRDVDKKISGHRKVCILGRKLTENLVWFVWSLGLLLVCLAVFAFYFTAGTRILRASLLTMLFGFSEPVFAPEYLNPSLLFDLYPDRQGVH